MSPTAGGGSTPTDAPLVRPRGSASPRAWSSRSWAGTPTPTTTCGSRSRTPIDSDMVDGDYGNVVDAVLLWWRDEDGDLVDGLVDSLTDLVGGRRHLAAHAEGRPRQRRRPRRHHRGRADRRPRPDHDRGGQQGLGGHPARHPEVARVTPFAPRVVPPGRRPGSDRARVRPARSARRRGCWAAPDSLRPAVAGGPGADRQGAQGVGHRPGRRLHRDGAARPRPGRPGRRARLADLRRRCTAAPTPWPGRWPSAGSARATASRSCAATTAASSTRSSRRPSVGADILLLNTAFAGPQLVEVLEREGPRVVVHDEEFTGLLAKADVATRLLGWVDERRPRRRRVDRGADPVVRRLRPRAARAPRPDRDPDLGHHRRPEGCAAQRGGRRRGRVPDVADAAALRLAHAHRGAAVPHLGLRPPGPVDAARLDGRAAPEVRPRGSACGGHRRALRLAGRDPGDAAADPRPPAARRSTATRCPPSR